MSFDWESHREKLVEERVEYLMSEGQEYYPFELTNFAEALQNINDSQVFRLNLLAGLAADPSKLTSTADAGLCLVSVVTEYWRAIATNSAERQIISTEEMRLNAKEVVENVRGF